VCRSALPTRLPSWRTVLTGDEPQYLRQFVRVADVPSHHRLRGPTSDDLIVPAVRLTSIGSRAFPVAGARIWNTLPIRVTSASSLTAFKLHLKLHLFSFSFPGLSPVWLLSGPCSVCCHLGHCKNFDWLTDWFHVAPGRTATVKWGPESCVAALGMLYPAGVFIAILVYQFYLSVCLSVCLSACPSFCRFRYCVKTNRYIVTLFGDLIGASF